MRLTPGTAAPPFTVRTITDETISLQGFAGKRLLLMFFRYASCPMCNLRLHDLARELPRLRQQGLEAVAFFHSSPKRIRRAAGKRSYPLHLVGDPSRTIYRAYGVETSWLRFALTGALPSFYVDWVRSMRHGFWGGFDPRMATMPADFLVDEHGRIARAHYGRDIGDHLSVREIAAFLAGDAAA